MVVTASFSDENSINDKIYQLLLLGLSNRMGQSYNKSKTKKGATA